jgi:hypothetical protein
MAYNDLLLSARRSREADEQRSLFFDHRIG